MAWVMLIRPMTLVENMMSRSSSLISGALSFPFTRPLSRVSVKIAFPQTGDINPRIVDKDIDVPEIR